ncbi:hypothetical protein Tco_0876667 [Tanacetum coccineum]|uniref:Reverse transcriptase domain-containing protein n=1 Tax=Tanacetum coccineum TaxID=301880 RepID=A0ABQ5BSW7_9ASTR
MTLTWRTFLFLEAILNEIHHHHQSHRSKEINFQETSKRYLKSVKQSRSNNEPPEVELKDLPPHLEYAFLEGGDKLPVIIAKDLKN